MRDRAGSSSSAAGAQPGLRERKKQRTRDQIARTALALFAERGYQQTTVADVADAAEVAERTVFTHFPTKEDLLFDDHTRLVGELAEALERRSPETPPLDTVRAFVVENLARTDESARLRRLIVDRDEHLRSHQRGWYAALGDVIAGAVAEDRGTAPDDFRMRLVAATVAAAVAAVDEHRAAARSRAAARRRAGELIDEAIAFVRGGLDATRSFPAIS